MPKAYRRYLITALLLVVLFMLYVFQRIDYAGFFLGDQSASPELRFIVNRTLRVLLNDTCCLGLILVWFPEPGYGKLASWVMVIELLVVLPLYFLIKLTWEGPTEISSPLLSQWHRLIVNPTLMILLMVGFYYQRRQTPRIS